MCSMIFFLFFFFFFCILIYFCCFFYRWKVADENLPHHSNFKSVSDLPADNSFSSEKTIEMTYTKGTMWVNHFYIILWPTCKSKSYLALMSVYCLIVCILLSFHFTLSYFSGGELIVKGLSGSAEEWQNFDDIKKIFWSKKTQMSGRVRTGIYLTSTLLCPQLHNKRCQCIKHKCRSANK